MPMTIEYIDAIARAKQRDVLYIIFTPSDFEQRDYFEPLESYNWVQDNRRKEICRWLDEHKIIWKPCGYFASENSFGSYRGQIYLDVPYDETNATYQMVREYLEYPDGSMRSPTIGFCYLPLENAMKNAHHDVPGFWEKWAETF